MEFLIFGIALAVFVAVIFCLEAYRAKKAEREFVRKLYQEYGTLSDKNYSHDRFEKLDSYFRRHSSKGQLDHITWNDLELDELFKRMNYTLSASGEEYLYYRLRTPWFSLEELKHFDQLVNYFGSHPKERVGLQYCMHKLGYTGKYSLYDYIDNLDYLGNRSNTKHLLADALLLACIPLLWLYFSAGIIGLVGIMIYNIISYFQDKGEIQPYITSFSYVLRLMEAADQICSMELPDCERECKEIRELRRTLRPLERNSFWVTYDTKSGSASGDIISALLDYVKMVFHVDIIKFNQMLTHLRAHVEQVDGLIGLVGYLETAVAVWIFRDSLTEGWCRPKLQADEKACGLSLEEGYHPLLSGPVKNSITADRGVLLTGSNASGKSTFLKTVAVNAVLAQSIYTCTGASYRAPFYLIYTSMALRDHIFGGESYYIVEIKALKRILDSAGAGEKILCFVDEVLRGTNTVERIAASTQILKTLGGKGILCFAATHDIELTELLGEQFDNYHFREEISEGDIRFDYRLLAGRATTRNAIKLLKLLGYEEAIIDAAGAQAEQFLESGHWKA